MKIRTFRQADTDDVVSLWKRCSLTVPWNNPMKDIARKLAVQAELFIVAEQDSRIVGSAMGGYDGHRGWLYYLAVDPDYRRQKTGSLLVREVEKRIEACGCPKINLMVRTANETVCSFYKNLGYRVDEAAVLSKRTIPD